MKDMESIKKIVLSCYKDISQTNKLTEFARFVEDPFLTEFSTDFDDIIKSKKNVLLNELNEKIESEAEPVIEELEELNEDADHNIDIEKLNEIEEKVIKILQYLNLELYNVNKIKEIIVHSMLTDLHKEEFSTLMKEKVEDVIAFLVEHEFKELTTKKKERRKKLILKLMDQCENIIAERIKIHKKSKFKGINKYQQENFKKFLFEDCLKISLLPMRNTDRVNFDEYLFLKRILKLYIFRQYKEKVIDAVK